MKEYPISVTRLSFDIILTGSISVLFKLVSFGDGFLYSFLNSFCFYIFLTTSVVLLIVLVKFLISKKPFITLTMNSIIQNTALGSSIEIPYEDIINIETNWRKSRMLKLTLNKVPLKGIINFRHAKGNLQEFINEVKNRITQDSTI